MSSRRFAHRACEIITRSRLVLLAVFLLAGTGCGESTLFDINRGNPVTIQLLLNPAFLEPAAPGAQLEVAARLTGSDREPVAAWPVVWHPSSASDLVTAPQGLVSADTTYTDEDGVAEVIWTLGAEPGAYHLDVRVAGTVRAEQGGTGPISPRPGPDLTITVSQHAK